jgi:hypothetical protein
VVVTGLTGVGQWTQGWCSAAFSGLWGWKLVPRFSSTLVATWTWSIWVVSRRRVLEAARVRLVGAFISFEKIFLLAPIHSPLSGSPYRSFKLLLGYNWISLCDGVGTRNGAARPKMIPKCNKNCTEMIPKNLEGHRPKLNIFWAEAGFRVIYGLHSSGVKD